MGTIQYEKLHDDNPPRLHLKLRKGDIGEYVIVPGDPFRCDWIASFLENPVLQTHSREIKIYTGTYKGIKVTCCSSGMGCPSTAIVCEELAQIGAKVLLRTGSGFMINPKIKAGDVGITTGSCKYEGTTQYFVPDKYPCIADIDLVTALVKTSRRILQEENEGYNVHTGITCTMDAFYGETDEFLQNLEKWHVMNLEMESAALITTAQRYQIRGGCICTCGKDDPSEEAQNLYHKTMDRQLRIALESFVELDKMIKNNEVINNL